MTPIEVGSLSHYLQGFIHPTGGWLFGMGFQNHQQYEMIHFDKSASWIFNLDGST